MDYDTFVWCFLTADRPGCEPKRKTSIPAVRSAIMINPGLAPVFEKELLSEKYPQIDEMELPFQDKDVSIEEVRAEYDALSSGAKWEFCRQFLKDDRYREQEWYIDVLPEENDCIVSHCDLSLLTYEPCYDQILKLESLDRKSCILTLLKIDYLGFEFAHNRINVQTTLQFSLVDNPEIKNSIRYKGHDSVGYYHYIKPEEEDLLKVPTYAIFKQHYTHVDALLAGAIQRKELSPLLDSGKEYFAPAHFFAWALVNGLTIPEPLQPLLLQFMKKPPYGATPSGGGKKKRRGAVTQKEAAEALGKKDERTIRNWLNGIGTPPGFPGLEDSTAFYCFVERQKSASRMRIAARAMNRAVPGGDMNEFSQGVDL